MRTHCCACFYVLGPRGATAARLLALFQVNLYCRVAVSDLVAHCFHFHKLLSIFCLCQLTGKGGGGYRYHNDSRYLNDCRYPTTTFLKNNSSTTATETNSALPKRLPLPNGYIFKKPQLNYRYRNEYRATETTDATKRLILQKQQLNHRYRSDQRYRNDCRYPTTLFSKRRQLNYRD